MRIILIGHGKMGKAVEQAALERGHTICTIVTSPGALRTLPAQAIGSADLCIDFSVPNAVVDHVQWAGSVKKPIVIGTTGWYDALDVVEDIAVQTGTPVAYSPNFSIGIHIFLQLVARATQLIDRFDYDVSGLEMHHRQKIDSPSGTAQAMAKEILKNSSKKNRVTYDCVNRPIGLEELHVASVRCGSIPGRHEVLLDSSADTISVSHTARNRTSLAQGAILAAEWLVDKPAGLYTMEQIFDKNGQIDE